MLSTRLIRTFATAASSLPPALPALPLFNQAIHHARTQPPTKPAILDLRTGKSHSYQDLVADVARLRVRLLDGKEDLNEARVAFLCPNGYAYVVTQWAVWAAGGIAVPLCTTHPAPELLYTLTDSQASIVLAHSLHDSIIQSVASTTGIPSLTLEDAHLALGASHPSPATPVPSLDLSRRALIIYTSGTTGSPKGVVTTHAAVSAQAESLVQAWRWESSDRILHVLPLHHVHGVVNALQCPLWAGATVEMAQKFDAGEVWDRWIRSYEGKDEKITVFMAVPTIYSKLIHHYASLPAPSQSLATRSCSQHRLTVSGSAALPTPLRREWQQISGGQILLERYGMTEIGMALSGGYKVEEKIEGTVGLPLPNVQVRLMEDQDDGATEAARDVTAEMDKSGEIQVKGPGVFKEYWNRPEATKKEFTEDGWFKTGDIAFRKPPQGHFAIMGRRSVDIIKSGGYKLSALEIEREMLSHPSIRDVAVVAVDDPEWGQRVAAIVVIKEAKTLDLAELREYFKPRMAHYKIPTLMRVEEQLPKNVMGKVNKKELAKLFDKEGRK